MLHTVTCLLVLVSAAIYDWRTQRVPNWLWLPAIALAISVNNVDWQAPHWPAAVLGLAAVVQAFWSWRKGAMGGGDAKAVMMTVAMVPAYPLAIVGLGLGIVLVVSSKDRRIPFVPWLAVGVAGAAVGVKIATGAFP